MTRLFPVFAFLFLTAFLGILLWEVPRLDLGAVIGVTLLLALADLIQSWRNS